MNPILFCIMLVIILGVWGYFIYLVIDDKLDEKRKKENTPPKEEVYLSEKKNNLKDLLQKFQKVEDQFLVPVGINEKEEVVSVDFNKTKNYLVIGTTGAGKSICLNEMIASISQLYSPEEVKFVTIDTSIVELSSFNGIPHYIKNTIIHHEEALEDLEELIKDFKKQELPERIVIIIDDYYDLHESNPEKTEKILEELFELEKTRNCNVILATDTPEEKLFPEKISSQIDGKFYLTLSPGTDKFFSLDDLNHKEKEYIQKIGNMIVVQNGSHEQVEATEVLEEEIKKIVDQY